MHRSTFLCLLVVASGCGQQAFNDRLEKGLVTIKYDAKFADLDPAPFTIFETPVSLRLPTQLSVRLPPNANNPEGEGPIPPQRMQPPGVALPGIRLLCQGIIPDERTVPVPFFCHVAAQPTNTPADVPLAEKIQSEVAKTYKPKDESEPIKWEAVTCETPEMGGSVTCKRLEARGEQNFQALGVLNPNMISGAVQVYLFEGQGWDVVMFWRVPDTLATRVPLADWAQRTCGTVKVAQQ